MISLSAENINQTAPYKVKAIDNLSLTFTTDFGVQYDVGFYKDTVFLIDGSYHFFISNANHKHSPSDTKILKTVINLLINS